MTKRLTVTTAAAMLPLGILWAGGVAGELPPVANDDAPVFRSLPLPARYRQKPTDREMFTMGEWGELTPGGRWYVTGLVQHDKMAKLYGAEAWGGGFSPKDQGITVAGLLAIEVKTGAARVLLWGDPADAGCGGCIVDHESCYVWLDRSGDPARKENASWAQRWGLDCAMYQWNFRTGRIEKRGYNWLIAEFAAAAGPAVAQRIEWPQRFEPNWDGMVRLRGKKPGQTIQFPLLDAKAARRPRPRPGSRDDNRPQFLRGSRDDEVMVFYEYADGPAGTWLSMISLDEPVKTRWTITRKQLDPDQQWELWGSQMARGISRNHRVVPLLAQTSGRGEEEARVHLYAIRPKDGALLLQKRLSRSYDTTGLAASNDGSLIAWAWMEGSYPFMQRSVGVLDASRGIVLAQRVYTIETAYDDFGTVCPAGFDSEKQLIVGHTESVWSLAPPYKGRFQPRFWLCPGAREPRR